MLSVIAKCLVGAAIIATSFAITLFLITPSERAASPPPSQTAATAPPRRPSPPEFDERLYLAMNPDVAEAVSRGQYKTGRDHYLAAGKAEGRQGAMVPAEWNEAGYLKANPDVAAAVAQGTFVSGYHHYLAAGRAAKRPGGFPATEAGKS